LDDDEGEKGSGVDDLGLICAGGRMWGNGCVSMREIQGDKNGGKFSRGQMRYRAAGRIYGEFHCFEDFTDIIREISGQGTSGRENGLRKIYSVMRSLTQVPS
jgi:hypothetical protein